MMISNEQALLAARDLQASHPGALGALSGISDAVLAAAHAVVDETPDMREDRVSEARMHLGAGSFDSHQVAEKMISRIISDSLR